MQYQREFGDEFDLGFDIRQFPNLTDKSWHNDVCPSFYIRTRDQYLVLWVDFEDPDQREFNCQRYTVVHAQNYGTDSDPEIYCNWESEPVFSTDSSNEAFEFLKLT